MRCCAGDEGCDPSASPCGGASNRLELRWLKTVVVSVRGKGARDASGGDREGERERTADDVSRSREMTSKPGRSAVVRDEPGGCPLIGQAVSGMKAARARSALLHGTWEGRLRDCRAGPPRGGPVRREGARPAAETVRR